MTANASEMRRIGGKHARAARYACCGGLGSTPTLLEDSLEGMDTFLAPFHSKHSLIDAHCHLQLFPHHGRSSILAEHLARHRIAGCSVCATSPADWPEVEALHLQAPTKILPSFGIHPWWLRDLFLQDQTSTQLDLPTYRAILTAQPSNWKHDLVSMLTKYPLAGVGECGVDKGIKDTCSLDVQFEVFKDHFLLAAEHSRCISIHCVGGWGRLLSCLQEMHTQLQPCWPASIILHSVNSLPPALAGAFCRLPRVYFSFSAAIAANEKQLQLWAALPTERLLLESDSPDQLPRAVADSRGGGHCNTPAILTYASAAIASSMGCDVEELRRSVTENAGRALGWTGETSETAI